jgi:putative ABC transport system permease protein
LGVVRTLLVRESIRALGRHKTRSLLTGLGIAIGVGALVLVDGVGRAGQQRAEEELQKLGDNLVWIEAGARSINGLWTGTHGTTSLTYDDEQAVMREVPLLKTCTPQVDGNVSLQHGARNWTTRFRGETPDYMTIRKWRVAEGQPLTDADVTESAGKMLIGQTVREQLFGAERAIGQLVRAQGQLFEVVGVLAPKGQSPDGRDQDDWVLLPFTSAEAKLRGGGFKWLDDILCSAHRPADVNPAIDRVIALLRQRHGIYEGSPDDFNIRRPDEVLKAQIEASDTLAALLLSISAVALIVGGIGIMNVMLASVLQRTAEIGLRMAVGARGAHIRMQFLGEAVLLCLLGGLAGVALSAVGSSLFEQVLGWSIAISSRALTVSVAASVTVGIVFGSYPAWRAARLDPMVALRRE